MPNQPGEPGMLIGSTFTSRSGTASRLRPVITTSSSGDEKSDMVWIEKSTPATQRIKVSPDPPRSTTATGVDRLSWNSRGGRRCLSRVFHVLNSVLKNGDWLRHKSRSFLIRWHGEVALPLFQQAAKGRQPRVTEENGALRDPRSRKHAGV